MNQPEEFHRAVDPQELLAVQQSVEADLETDAPANPEQTPEPLVNRIDEVPEKVRRTIKPHQRVTNWWPSEYVPRETMMPAEEALARLTAKGTPDASLGKEGGVDVENLDQGKFAVLFGRDSLKIIKFLRESNPELIRPTLMKLAEFQSAETDPAADKKPGGIIHELRLPGDPIADMLTRERGWKLPYYGAVDSTPMFISALAVEGQAEDGADFLDRPVTRYDDNETVTLRQSLEDALAWLEQNQAQDEEFGFVTYKRQNPGGIENQILRDSPDSMSDKTGRIANHERPIASLQVQANTYDAYIDAAELFEKEAERTGDAALADRAMGYRERAQKLHDAVIKKFFIEDERGGFFAVGLDQDDNGEYRPLDTRTNDMAYLLSSKLLTNEGDRPYVEKLVATLESDEMKVGSGGLRSLSKLEVNFNPAAYHNGSDWLVADADYAEGLLQHGFKNEAIAVYQWIVEACESSKAYPEYVMGGESEAPEINDIKVEISTSTTSNKEALNMLMQPPEMGQGWSIAAYVLAKQRLAELLGAAETADEPDEDELVA